MSFSRLLNREKGLIFRITHLDNVSWILEHGLHCRNSAVRDPNFREIGNPDLIAKRAPRPVPVPPGGTLSDYVPFYFTPYSPMLLNIKTGYNGMQITPMPDIAMLVTSVHDLEAKKLPFVITDRHAYLEVADWFNDSAGLDAIDWGILQARDFKRDGNDPGKVERYQAEALVHQHLPADVLTGLVVHGEPQFERLAPIVTTLGLPAKLVARPDWYF